MTLNFRRTVTALALCGTLVVPAAAFADGSLVWSGNVDDTAIVSVHGRDVQTQTVSGNSVRNTNAQFNGRLPHRPVFVSLGRWSGRGRVRVVQQPRPDNDFTARVRIHDPQPGSSNYRFVLNW